jgi:hypothetical protein
LAAIAKLLGAGVDVGTCAFGEVATESLAVGHAEIATSAFGSRRARFLLAFPAEAFLGGGLGLGVADWPKAAVLVDTPLEVSLNICQPPIGLFCKLP